MKNGSRSGSSGFGGLLLCAVLTLASGGAAAQEGSSLPRIGVLAGGNEASNRESLRQMREGLLENGLVDGKNVALVFRYANGEIPKLPALAAELLRERVDLVFAGGDAAIGAAKRATTSVPIVMVACDALAAGFITSLSKPGGNLTGVTCINSDLAAKRLEILKELMPQMTRLGAIAYPNDVRVAHELEETLKAAPRVKIGVTRLAAETPEALERLIAQTGATGGQAILTINNSFTFFQRKLIADAALRQNLPMISNFSEYADAGGLISYGPSLPAMYRQATPYVARILNGERPGNLPVAQATRFELVVNVRTAKAIGMTLPASILVRADRVIE